MHSVSNQTSFTSVKPQTEQAAPQEHVSTPLTLPPVPSPPFVCLLSLSCGSTFPLADSRMSNSSFRRSSSLLACALVLYLVLISDLIISLLLVYVGLFGANVRLFLAVSVVASVANICLLVSNVLFLAALCDLLLQGDRNALHAGWAHAGHEDYWRFENVWTSFWWTRMQVIYVSASVCFQHQSVSLIASFFSLPQSGFLACVSTPHHHQRHESL